MKKNEAASSFWVLEDTSSYYERTAKPVAGTAHSSPAPIEVRLHKVKSGTAERADSIEYVPRVDRRAPTFKAALAVELVRRAKVRRGAVVAGSRFNQSNALMADLLRSGIGFVAALPPSRFADLVRESDANGGASRSINDALANAAWRDATFSAPDSGAHYRIADLGILLLDDGAPVRLLALSAGGIADYARGLIVGASSLEIPIDDIGYLLGWTRWIRFSTRRASRKRVQAAAEAIQPARNGGSSSGALQGLTPRVNKKHTVRHDGRIAGSMSNDLFDSDRAVRGRLSAGRRHLNMVELFAGAGGMGLGFLMADDARERVRILFSGEIDPVYANTLRVNHDFVRSKGHVVEDAVPNETLPADLRAPSVMHRVQALSHDHDGVDIVIGGPPCQGFSSANRNSASSWNPNNFLVDTYLDYVVRLKPRVFVMENVQGILWTPKHGSTEISVAEHVVERVTAAGYRIYPKLVDSAWYGVPQHRNRFFLVGIHSDLGYAHDDFGEWGPFPRPSHGPMGSLPYVTVREAISDLPPVGNGAADAVLPYKMPSDASAFLHDMRRWADEGKITDHVTSRHADYVIERYERIPAGGNWSDIESMMTNYAAVGRTHSNIYRRLLWDEPSITIGHYRKAMLIHPDQHRGLSLREAARLQSFPDWFRFAGGATEVEGGLTHKQQQVGNAVAPLVTRALGSYLLRL